MFVIFQNYCIFRQYGHVALFSLLVNKILQLDHGPIILFKFPFCDIFPTDIEAVVGLQQTNWVFGVVCPSEQIL